MHDDLIKKLRTSCHITTTTVYKEGYGYCRSFLKKNGAQDSLIDDYFQEAMIVLITRCKDPNFKLTCQPKVFLATICRNIFYKKLKDNRFKATDEEMQILLEHKADETIDFVSNKPSHDVLDVMRIFDNQFNDSFCKQLLSLYYFEQKKHEEIAVELNISLDNSRKRKERCLGKLKLLVNPNTKDTKDE